MPDTAPICRRPAGEHDDAGRPANCLCAEPSFCKNCGKHITNEGYAPPMWWHFHNGSRFCGSTTAEPMTASQQVSGNDSGVS